MFNPINKRIYRQVKLYPGKVLMVFMAIVFLVIFASSFFTAQDSAKHLYYRQLSDGKVEDGEFTVLDKLTDVARERLRSENITLYENFYREVNLPDNKCLRVFINRQGINEAQILNGRLAEAADEIAVDGNYARANGLVLGDEIKTEGGVFKLVGTVSTPDYSSVLKRRADLVMDTGYFGLGFVSRDGWAALKDGLLKYVYAYHTAIKLDKYAAADKLKSVVQEVSKDNLVLDAVTRYDNKCITYLMDDMDGDVPTITLTIVILFVAIAFISAVQIKSLIEEEAPVIGTLLAMGYTRRELTLNYMAMPVGVAVAAAVIGNLLAYGYLYHIYVDLYYQSFNLPNFEARLTARSFLLTTVIPTVIYLVINFAVIWHSLRFSPLAFLRRNLHKHSYKSWFSLRHRPFLSKVRLRMLFDNKLNLAALLIGIFIADLLLMYGLAARPGFDFYTKSMQEDMKYNYATLVRQPELHVEAEQATWVTAEMTKFDNRKISLYGVGENSRYALEGYKDLAMNEAIASDGLLKRFRLSPGDKLSIREPYNNKIVVLTLKRAEPHTIALQLVLRQVDLNRILGVQPNYFNTYFSDKKLSVDPENLVTQIDRNEMAKFMEYFMNSFGIAFDMIKVIGVVFFLIITLIISGVIIDKARQNLAYLKVFGFSNAEIAGIYIYPVLVLLIIYQILLFPFLRMAVRKIIYFSMIKLDAYIDVPIPFNAIFTVIGLSVGVFFVVQLVQNLHLRRINMVESLKTLNG